MSTRDDPLIAIVTESLTGAGFRRKKRTFYKEGADAVAGVHLQGSQYGRRFYINLGAYFGTVSSRGFISATHWDISGRLEVLNSERWSELEVAFDMDEDLDWIERQQLVASFIGQTVSVCEVLASLDTCRAFISSPEGSRFLITPFGRKRLGL